MSTLYIMRVSSQCEFRSLIEKLSTPVFRHFFVLIKKLSPISAITYNTKTQSIYHLDVFGVFPNLLIRSLKKSKVVANCPIRPHIMHYYLLIQQRPELDCRKTTTWRHVGHIDWLFYPSNQINNQCINIPIAMQRERRVVNDKALNRISLQKLMLKGSDCKFKPQTVYTRNELISMDLALSVFSPANFSDDMNIHSDIESGFTISWQKY
ncbi:hypothetical protein X798_01907 [Onchocerca flexuosa]|uniref:Uncharacterized protein n=1 Tax=Onchocerca flexuosa TaxID=387005 RepID=A0A238C0V3_9BILA|nr:hypothetical protein X798_01907 [Onchocerca flexuosa]